jgi:DNA-binding response OmpR family regulator
MTANEKKGKIILLVEDDSFMAGLLERKFEQDKYKILRATSATQAREEISKNAVDLILLDVVLPGLDGFSFLKELKSDQKTKVIPVIISSNLGQPEEIERGMQNGAAGYIVKANTTPGEIVEKVESTLSG